jgi:hypothetical protein
MNTIFLLYSAGFILMVLLFTLGVIIERNFKESHPVKKWWRKHIIGLDPNQKSSKDDNVE